MNPESAIETSREAITVCIMVGGPILAICLIVGLLMGLAQAMSHIQDQAIATVPKLLAIFVAVGFALPWMSETLAEFSTEQFSNPFLNDSIGFQQSDQNRSTSKASVSDSALTTSDLASVFPTLDAAPLSTSIVGASSFKPVSFDRQAKNTLAPKNNVVTDPAPKTGVMPQFKLPSTTPSTITPAGKPSSTTTSPNPFSLPSFRYKRSDDSNMEG